MPGLKILYENGYDLGYKVEKQAYVSGEFADNGGEINIFDSEIIINNYTH